MAYQTLYRKYRPKTFEFVYGQDVIVKTLKNVIKNNKLSHAYLFTGPRGTGKTSCAKLFAKSINCLNNNNGDACNECKNCKAYNNNENPDIIEIDAASNNGVDEIREIRNKVTLVPAFSKYKVYIIDEVHMLSIGAFNALLKTLEEPPSHVIFILATTEPQKLPITVISRCQRFDFKSISANKMRECLNNIIKKEKINVEDDALNELIDNSAGGMRDAIGMLDQAWAFCDDIITKKDIEDLSGTISINEIKEFVKSIINQDYKSCMNYSSDWSEKGKDLYLILQKLLNYIKNLLLYKKNIKILDNEYILEISEKNIYILIEEFINLSNSIQNTMHKHLMFDVGIMKLINKFNFNVSRETLNNSNSYKNKSEIDELEVKEEKKIENLPNKEKDLEIQEYIQELKNVRINNIIKESSKLELQDVKQKWSDLNSYLVNEKYKIISCILLESNPVASSRDGLIITVPAQNLLDKIELRYDESKDLILKVLKVHKKIVFLLDKEWIHLRPKFIKMVKSKSIDLKDENSILKKIKENMKDDSLSEFSDLIEMEE